MTERKTQSNLAARLLFDVACAWNIESAAVTLSSISSDAAGALHVWAKQRDVPLDSILQPAAALTYDRRTVYCFRFAMNDLYNGVVCIDTFGTVLAEDSRVSV